MAMTNTFATIPGIVVPIFVGVLTHGNVSFTVNLSSPQIMKKYINHKIYPKANKSDDDR